MEIDYIRSKRRLCDDSDADADNHHNTDNYHHSDGSDGAHSARYHSKKANKVCA